MNRLLPWNITHKKKCKSGRWHGLLATLPKRLSAVQFNFKIWRAPKWVTFPSLAKPHKQACLGLLEGHLLCCSKQTDILVVNPKHLHMLSLPKPDWCKYFEWCTFGVRLLQRRRLKNQTQIAIGKVLDIVSLHVICQVTFPSLGPWALLGLLDDWWPLALL